MRKRTHFQSSHILHHLQVLCQGGHEHLYLRGHGRAASSAQYPKEECERIMNDGLVSAGASEGGRNPPSPLLSFDGKMQVLENIAKDKGLKKQWDQIVLPWWNQTVYTTAKVAVASEPSAVAEDPATVGESSGGNPSSDEVPHLQPVELESPQPDPSSGEKKTLQDLVVGLKTDDIPWQNSKYSANNAVWQGAALRRRMHPRRTNVALGTCSADLSGPHEPTPRPGAQIGKNPCHYFLALTVRPDQTAGTHEIGVQTTAEGAEVEEVIVEQPRESKGPKPPLIYAALLGTKNEAPKAVKHILAQINNDHASFPTEIVFRFHSDKGGEFINEELNDYCLEHGIHKTSTAGYDPNANPAENTVGALKRRSRYLLSGARFPTNWWGVGTLASAQLFRADAGLEDYPRIPFGTRVMIVDDPKPRNSFVPRAQPGTIFGPSSSVSGGMWTYQKGIIKCRTNLVAQGMEQPDLHWVKINLSNWDPPDGPEPLPEPQLYDAASLIPTRFTDGGATRQTAVCPACLQIRRKRKMTQRHSLRWGECLNAVPPPPVAEADFPDVGGEVTPVPDEVEEQPEVLIEELMSDVEDGDQLLAVASAAVSHPTFAKFIEYPHACIAWSEAATWGSSESTLLSETDVPPSADITSCFEDEADMIAFDDIDDEDFVVDGGTSGYVDSPEVLSGGPSFDGVNPDFPSPQSNPLVLSPSDQPQGFEQDPCEAEVDENVVSLKRKRRWKRDKKLSAVRIHGETHHHNTLHKGTPSSSSTTRRRRRSHFGSLPGSYMYPNWLDYVAAATVEELVESVHVDALNREAMQQLIREEGVKRIVKPQEVRNSTGPTLERWKAAAEAELTNNFVGMGAVHESTPEELAAHGRPLPMLCVWSQAEDYNKCRACVCGNFADSDPTQQSWTAQAEPSSLLAGLKLGRAEGWTVSKHDVKGAFLNAKIPEG
ncbi:MAG: hypothetical protein QGH82_06730, partial [Candidatus Woesearchaeota archaeon]|nr:hypothetical protein [Candidatus Woesearchaeota archaeon]